MKSRIVFAPAGSGKTELLSTRYLELVEAGVKPERILTLTFTEKAAAEMKERILTNARKSAPEIYQILRNNILKLRISTIHSFCLSLVRRFADLLNLDPHLEVLSDPNNLWLQAKYDTLMKIAEGGRGFGRYRNTLVSLITRNHINGWQELSGFLDRLFSFRTAALRGQPEEEPGAEIIAIAEKLRESPCGRRIIPNYSELFPANWTLKSIERAIRNLKRAEDKFLTTNNEPRVRGFSKEEQIWAREMKRYRTLLVTVYELDLFRQCFGLFQECFLKTYNQAKRELGVVDYEDMEFFALKLLSEIPEWQNILFIFDEHTDHILVDEFQDTSYRQWEIIDKLTEEWRAGQGKKSELGITPTIFIVGDDQQSIYYFRNARVELFFKAREKLEQWLGPDRLETITIKENYRSLPAIIDFNNVLFSKLFQDNSFHFPTDARLKPCPTGEQPVPWRTRYKPFVCKRAGSGAGLVELLIEKAPPAWGIAEYRARDAQNVARRIKSLVSSGFEVWERNISQRTAAEAEVPRPCEFKDIAILIRKRDDFLPAIEDALRENKIPFLVVGGTGFYEEKEIKYLCALLSFLVDPADDLALYITLRGPFFNIPERDLFLEITRGKGHSPFLWEQLKTSCRGTTGNLPYAVNTLMQALKQVNYRPLFITIDQILIQTKAYQTFYEPQRLANIKKFLQIIQELELNGTSPLRIKTLLERPEVDEAKADVNTEGTNAVQILTVHAAKGLQFPIVFHPGLQEKILSQPAEREKLVVEETAVDRVIFSYLSDKDAQKENRLHQEYRLKLIEEEKRIFYVACTRARDALFLSGIYNEKDNQERTKFWWLKNCLGLKAGPGRGFSLAIEIPNVCLRPAAEIPVLPVEPVTASRPTPLEIKIIGPRPALAPQILSVTEYTPLDLVAHSEETIGTGDIIHRLLELLAQGLITPEPRELEQEIIRLLRAKSLPRSCHPELKIKIKEHIERLVSVPECWEIIRPQPNSFAELPITFNDGKTLYNARIDRVIFKPDEVWIYDYKTFPVRRAEIPVLKERFYSNQLVYYARAASFLFAGKKVLTFLVFTAIPEIVPCF